MSEVLYIITNSDGLEPVFRLDVEEVTRSWLRPPRPFPYTFSTSKT